MAELELLIATVEGVVKCKHLKVCVISTFSL